MLDSLYVLLSVLAFIVFGYLSLVRLLYKLPLGDSWRQAFRGLWHDFEHTVQVLGLSTLLVALPASSLLLFWGWGPAVLWLVIFHLLFETVINLGDAAGSLQLNQRTSLMQAKSDSSVPGKLPALLWQALMLLLCAVLLTQLARMIDQHSGLLWALLFLIPASSILSTSNSAISKTAVQLGAAVVFCFGLILADNLGLSVYGSWAPFGYSIDWLVLNNASMSALGLLVAGRLLTANDNFTNNLASLSGYLLLSCLLMLLVAIIIVRPELDAPIQSVSQRSESLPSIFTVSFILFGSVLALTLRLFSQPRIEPEPSVPGQFAKRQSVALVQLVLSIILLIALAAAMGIGAWNTHYVDWSWSADFLRHFELSLSSLFTLIANQSDVGSMAHTLFVIGATMAILSLLLFCLKNLTLHIDSQSAESDFSAFLTQSKLIHSIVIFLLCCYFLNNGVSLTIWATIGLLAWFLLCHHMLRAANKIMQKQDQSERYFQRIYSALCLTIICLGWLQLIFLAINWFSAAAYFATAAASVLLLTSALLWQPRIKILLPHFKSIKDPALFK